MCSFDIDGEVTTMIRWEPSIPLLNQSCIIIGLDDGTIEIYDIHHIGLHLWLQKSKTRRNHNDSITGLLQLSNNKLFSFSKGQAVIWSHETEEVVRLDLMGFDYGNIDSVVELRDNLVAVSGHISDSCEAFQVNDTHTGNVVHRNQGYMHRPHGVSLGRTIGGRLAVLGHCANLTVWNVDREVSEECSQIESQRSYCMKVLPTGEIITGGFSLEIFHVDSKGQLSLQRKVDNRNVICEIHLLDGYQILTEDCGQNHAGILRIWDLQNMEFNKNGDVFNFTTSLDPSVVFPSESEGVIFVGKKQKLEWENLDFKGKLESSGSHVASIRKYTRIIAQARRTNSVDGLGSLPNEILLKIISSIFVPDLRKETVLNIAEAYFSKPGQLLF